jgi:hypothetical protein
MLESRLTLSQKTEARSQIIIAVEKQQVFHMCAGAWASACACVQLALLIHFATRMGHIVTSFVASFFLHHIFRHYLINGTIFGKKLPNLKYVFTFSPQVLYKTFFILRTI